MQNLTRLKREVNAYGRGLFDRMLRIDNELRIVVPDSSYDKNSKETINTAGLIQDLEPLFIGIARYKPDQKMEQLYGRFDAESVAELF